MPPLMAGVMSLGLMESDKYTIKIQSSNTELEAEITVNEYDDESVELILSGNDILLQANSDNAFDALTLLREKAARLSISLNCYGSALNVYPSGMSKSMGIGDKAYKLTLGKQSLLSDIVDIFESEDDLQIVSPLDQSEFHQKWINSLG